MLNRRTGKVYVLALVPPPQQNLLATPQQLVRASLTPGSNVFRYGREWIVGQTGVTAGVLSGRIGFRGAEGVAEIWDEAAQDFTAVAVPAGLTAPFAVRLDSLRLAVQTRGSDIKLNGLVGAFQALLSGEGERWQVRSPTREMSFAEWRASVDRVTSVRFKVRKPNPHYQGTPDLEAMIEQAEARLATLELASDEGLDTAAPFIAQSQRHVERGYGEAVYHGVREETSAAGETVYNSALGAEEVAHEVDVDEHGEASQASLTETLIRDTATTETGGDGANG